MATPRRDLVSSTVCLATIVSSQLLGAESGPPSTEAIAAALRDTTVDTLYVISSSHWDLGFADPTDVIQDRIKPHLDEVIENCREHEGLRWTVESVWQIQEWLERTPDQAERREFFELVAAGRIGISAAFGGMHTAHMGLEEVCRFLYAGQRLADTHGLVIDTVMMDDVPGYSWALPQALRRAGVRHVMTGVNTTFGGRLTIPIGDRPFWWVGRDGSRVLTWVCDRYDESAGTYHLPPTAARFFADVFGKPWLKPIKSLDRILEMGLAMGLQRLLDAGYRRRYAATMWSMDFVSSDHGVTLATWVDRWNITHERPKIAMVTPSQFFAAAVAADGDDFPEYSGDFSGLWETGQATAPTFRANTNALRELLGPLDTVATLASLCADTPYPAVRLDDAWRTLLQCHEHGLGLGVGWPKLMTRQGVLHNSRFVSRLAEGAADGAGFLLFRHVRAIADRARVDVPSVLVMNPLPWRRSGVVSVDVSSDVMRKGFSLVDEAGEADTAYDVLPNRAGIRFIARNLPSVGYRRYRLEVGRQPSPPTDGPVAEADRLLSSAFDLQLDTTTGRVTSIADRRTGRQLLSGDAPAFARLLTRPHLADFFGKDAYSAADEGTPTITFENRTTSASLTVARADAPLSRLTLTAHRGLDPLVVEMVLDRRRARHVPRKEHSDHYYAAFGFGMEPEGVRYGFDGPAGILDAERDFLPGAMRGRVVAQHMVEAIAPDGHGVAMHPREACICSIGRTSSRGGSFRPEAAQFLWKLLSDADQGVAKDLGLVSYTAIEPGPPEAVFHFALRVVQDGGGGTASWRAGVEQASAPTACFLPVAVKPLFAPMPPRRPAQQSFLDIAPDSVVLLTLKRPDDGSRDGIIMRFAELRGRAADVVVTTAFAIQSAARHDLVERRTEAEALPVGPLRFAIAPHEIVTIRASCPRE